jgi:hypothetical protein
VFMLLLVGILMLLFALLTLNAISYHCSWCQCCLLVLPQPLLYVRLCPAFNYGLYILFFDQYNRINCVTGPIQDCFGSCLEGADVVLRYHAHRSYHLASLQRSGYP